MALGPSKYPVTQKVIRARNVITLRPVERKRMTFSPTTPETSRSDAEKTGREVPDSSIGGQTRDVNALKRRPKGFSREATPSIRHIVVRRGLSRPAYQGVAPSIGNLGASRDQTASIVSVGLNHPLETTETNRSGLLPHPTSLVTALP